MDRRKFVRLAGLGVTSGALADSIVTTPADTSQDRTPEKQARTKRRLLMKVGTQHGSSDEILGYLAAFGVNHICSSLPSQRLDAQWSVDGLMRLRERVESFGIKLDMIPLPLSSHYITRAENPNIMLGKSPERDREIDDICKMIANTAKAGIPALKYNMSILGVVRTEATKGRGGATYSTFVYDQARQEP